MLTRDTETEYGTLTIAVSWILLPLLIAQIINATIMPQTPLDERAPLISTHMSLGLTVFLLVIARLVLWAQSPRQKAPTGLPESVYGFQRLMLLSLYVNFAVLAFIGLLSAWAHGYDVRLFWFIPLPGFLPETYPVIVTLGYFHSAMMFYATFVLPIYLIFGIYMAIRYKVGLLRLLPGKAV